MGKIVKAGDYVVIRPENDITHDNTGQWRPSVCPLILVLLPTAYSDSNQPLTAHLHARP